MYFPEDLLAYNKSLVISEKLEVVFLTQKFNSWSN
jgi:hypothetical protein